MSKLLGTLLLSYALPYVYAFLSYPMWGSQLAGLWFDVICGELIVCVIVPQSYNLCRPVHMPELPSEVSLSIPSPLPHALVVSRQQEFFVPSPILVLSNFVLFSK